MSKINFRGSESEKWLEGFARFGIICKGIVYCLIGVITILAAFGLRKEKGDKTEAVQLIHQQPFGKIILIIIAVGLFGYVMWKLFQTFRDTDHQGNSFRGLLIRAGYAGTAAIYIGLALYALNLAAGTPLDDEDLRTFFVRKTFTYSLGRWIIGLIGAGTIAAGMHNMYKGLSGRFMRNVNLPAEHHDTLKKAGTIGYVARGIVWSILGYFLIRAALYISAGAAKGTEGAFDFLQNTFGTIIMCVVASGLIGYGMFMFVKARYQRISLPSS